MMIVLKLIELVYISNWSQTQCNESCAPYVWWQTTTECNNTLSSLMLLAYNVTGYQVKYQIIFLLP